MERLADRIEQENDRLGLQPTAAVPCRPDDEQKDPATVFGPEPPGDFDYFVSYAWGDDTPEGKQREAYVDALCTETNRWGREDTAR